ncbi:MAG: CvpA family protein [Planctomycetes bacterium]|nr:CvpA family protein [Planctomycetota bacterium]
MGNLSVADWIDVVALAVVLWGLGRGLFRGPVREILSSVGVLLAFVAAVTLYRPAYAWSGFDLRTGSETVGHLVWFGILLFGTGFVFRLADIAVRKFTEKTGGLSLSSRLWGGGIGALKGSAVVLFVAFFAAALPLQVLGLRLPFVEDVRASRSIRFADANQWVIRWVARTDLVGGLRSYLLDGTSAAMAEALVPGRDPQVHDRSRQALRALLEDPEILDRLGQSETACRDAERLHAHPGFAGFLRDSTAVKEASADGKITLREIKAILDDAAARERIEELLDDPAFRDLVLSIDVERIRSEVDSGESGDEEEPVARSSP